MASSRRLILGATLSLAVTAGCQSPTTAPRGDEWLTVTEGGFSIRATRADSARVPLVRDAIRDGEGLARAFFSAPALQAYAISIYPDRASLTDRWRVAWQSPSFQAQCWMIAAAWGSELDFLSPGAWSRDACGHDANNTTHIRNVLAHEVVHVLHAQLGSHQNLGTMLNAQWFTEGLAVYVSGMLDVDSAGIVHQRLAAGFAPKSLAEVWQDGANYPLSGSIVRYIDRKYGRTTVKDLLSARSSVAILGTLGVSEAELLSAWRADASSSASFR